MNTTNDPKEYTIRVRVNSDMRRYVTDKCRMRGVTISEIIRDMISRDMASNLTTSKRVDISE